MNDFSETKVQTTVGLWWNVFSTHLAAWQGTSAGCRALSGASCGSRSFSSSWSWKLKSRQFQQFHLPSDWFLPDNSCIDLILPVLENSLLRGLLLIVGLLQLDLERGKGHELDSLLQEIEIPDWSWSWTVHWWTPCCRWTWRKMSFHRKVSWCFIYDSDIFKLVVKWEPVPVIDVLALGLFRKNSRFPTGQWLLKEFN